MTPSFELRSVLTVGAIAAGLSLVLRATFAKGRQYKAAKGYSLPPGPTPIPIIGSALSIKASEPWVTYAQWSARYGDIFMIRVLNQDIIVISSEKIAKALLERRSSVYSDRPYLATREPFGWTFNFGWTPYGDRWRSQRRMFHQVFRADAAVAFHPVQLQKARQLVLDLLNSPGDYATHLQRFSAAVIMSIVYDYEIDPHHDHLVELFERGNSLAMEGLTPESASVVATFPFVLSLPEWFPGARLARKATLSKQCAMQMISEPFEHARKRVADGTASPGMAPDLLRTIEDAGDSARIQLVKETCASAFVAGAETATSTLHFFVLAMLQYPQVQKRAQAEIDEVVGVGRLPNFDDRSSLPYVEAVLRETLRMYPVAPLGKYNLQCKHFYFDDSQGFHTRPRVTTALSLGRAMYRNEDKYPEPNVFKPERFFVGGRLNDEVSTASLVFGFGRRMCPGRYTADASVWAAMVTILSLLNISKPLDDQGNEIEVNPQFTYGVTTAPLPFPCSITPRQPGLDISKLLEPVV
ncbi:hypothetical protein HYDPIDRAFT_145813 [Hydnomerulius pinastri MD-312]|nr:hypothetical protein HYDPIDRAFT_145813 [Hydnomerulius pinastri MD-312]